MCRECQIVDASRMSNYRCVKNVESSRMSNRWYVENVESSIRRECQIVNTSKMSNYRCVENGELFMHRECRIVDASRMSKIPQKLETSKKKLRVTFLKINSLHLMRRVRNSYHINSDMSTQFTLNIANPVANLPVCQK